MRHRQTGVCGPDTKHPELRHVTATYNTNVPGPSTATRNFMPHARGMHAKQQVSYCKASPTRNHNQMILLLISAKACALPPDACSRLQGHDRCPTWHTCQICFTHLPHGGITSSRHTIHHNATLSTHYKSHSGLQEVGRLTHGDNFLPCQAHSPSNRCFAIQCCLYALWLPNHLS